MARIEFDAESRSWLLHTPRTSYAFRWSEDEVLLHVYWGPRIGLPDAVRLARLVGRANWISSEGPFDGVEELPLEGGFRFGQPALAMQFADGVSGLELTYADGSVRETTAGAELVVSLRDRAYPVGVDLSYRVYDDVDVIDRWVMVRNDSSDQVAVRTAFSAAWTVPFRDTYRLSHLHGHWGGESRLNQLPLAPGEMVLGSRKGVTSHGANPWFAIDDGSAGEEHGEVWSGGLAWSGSWRFVAGRFPNGRAQVSGGFGQDGVDAVRLAPHEMATTPVFSALYSTAGFGSASREWHTYQLRHVIPNAKKIQPVLYNSWGVTGFDVDEQNQCRLARAAADLGVELFVVDDGWFGGRRHDGAGLGDWFPSPERFPRGLDPLIDEVHRLGMGFGLWVEPEMVNPDSELYRAHPDWIYHHPTRRRSEKRNQLVLNFARDDVAAWAYETLDTLLRANAIDYIKWDMNRPITEPGWPESDHPERMWVGHVRNLYDILDRLRDAHPGVAFESCSAGGGRADLGILRRTDMVWPSDNTDVLDRLVIHHGFTQLYAPRVMSAWVTDSPSFLNRHYPLKFRFHAAMAGLLGIGADILAWSEQDRAEATELISTYKRIRPIIHDGSLYRLRSPATNALSAVQYVAREESGVVVIAWLHGQRFGRAAPTLRLRGLDPTAHYRDVDTGDEWSGTLLLQHGLPLRLGGDFDSQLIQLERV